MRSPSMRAGEPEPVREQDLTGPGARSGEPTHRRWYPRHPFVALVLALLLLTVASGVLQYAVCVRFVGATARQDLGGMAAVTAMDPRLALSELDYAHLAAGDRVGDPFPVQVTPVSSEWFVPVFSAGGGFVRANRVFIRWTSGGYKVQSLAGG